MRRAVLKRLGWAHSSGQILPPSMPLHDLNSSQMFNQRRPIFQITLRRWLQNAEGKPGAHAEPTFQLYKSPYSAGLHRHRRYPRARGVLPVFAVHGEAELNLHSDTPGDAGCVFQQRPPNSNNSYSTSTPIVWTRAPAQGTGCQARNPHRCPLQNLDNCPHRRTRAGNHNSLWDVLTPQS